MVFVTTIAIIANIIIIVFMSCQLCGFLYAEIGDNFFILIGIDLNISRWNFSGAIWKSQESAKYPKKDFHELELYCHPRAVKSANFFIFIFIISILRIIVGADPEQSRNQLSIQRKKIFWVSSYDTFFYIRYFEKKLL